MRKYLLYPFTLVCVVFAEMTCSSQLTELNLEQINASLISTHAPVLVSLELRKRQKLALEAGRLGIIPKTDQVDLNQIIPVQWTGRTNDSKVELIFQMPENPDQNQKFQIIDHETVFPIRMTTFQDSTSKQIIIEEDGKKVVQYNYQTIYEEEVIRPGEEIKEVHTRNEKDTFVTTSIYAVPRSDYIHPLYGLEGEILTRDWPEGGHPHHRGIFWAWPEVEYGSLIGDIYALQKIFARPTGKIKLTSGPVFAQVIAENLWLWQESDTLVHEKVLIRVYHSINDTRIIDLTIYLLALKDSITIATRGTNSYGGLNLRLQTPQEQDISYFTDPDGSSPQRAWSDFSGLFLGNANSSGLMVLQHNENPEYPGAWVEYPDLAWVQPTFPTPNTRYSLSRTEPLILKYRLINHTGGRPSTNKSKQHWDAYHNVYTPKYGFDE